VILFQDRKSVPAIPNGARSPWAKRRAGFPGNAPVVDPATRAASWSTKALCPFGQVLQKTFA
jgi:hypothetical protein